MKECLVLNGLWKGNGREYEKEIMDKINSFFGYNCISHVTLKIVQDTIKVVESFS